MIKSSYPQGTSQSFCALPSLSVNIRDSISNK